jgi:hypothetical protein
MYNPAIYVNTLTGREGGSEDSAERYIKEQTRDLSSYANICPARECMLPIWPNHLSNLPQHQELTRSRRPDETSERRAIRGTKGD